MDSEANMHDLLERMLHDASVEPTQLPLSLLKAITNNFSDGHQIGSGGFSVVYKGLLQNGTVAVKKLSQSFEVDEKIFSQEVDSLMRVKHENIVRFIGYCADTQGKVCKYEGKNVMAEERERLLCFEFMPKGSLDKYVNDASKGLDWRTRYNIIKGICEGLYYLHQNSIVHLDLKPANILLDNYMVPKIADFGISRCFDEKQTRATTSKLYGTLGYMAPEFYDRVITFKSDVYSLGTIIIEMLTGRKGYPDIDNVLKNWSTRFGNLAGDPRLEHVKACVEMGIKFIHPNPVKRPTTRHIIDMLVEMEHIFGFDETDMCTSPAADVLDVYPLNVWFALLEPNKLIKCPVTLTNRTDDLIGVCIKPSCPDACFNLDYPYVWGMKYGNDDPVSSLFRTLWPHSSETIYMTMRKQQQPLLQAYKGMFDVVMVATKSKEDLYLLGQHWSYGSWRDESEDLRMRVKEFGTVVHLVKLRAAAPSDLTRCREVVARQFIQPLDGERRTIYCMDVHPTETWLLVGYSAGHVSIWNYETQERVIMFEVTSSLPKFKYPGSILSIKFIDGEKWFVAGDEHGSVHVYAYPHPEKDKVKEFEAHRNKAITNLVVHSTHTLLLTASSEDKSIKQWDWSQGWTCARVIDTHATVSNLMVGLKDTSTFASHHLDDDSIKVWGIHSSDTIATFEGCRFTFYTDGHQDFLATICFDSHTSSINGKIWDLHTKKHVHTLCPGMWPWRLWNLACHSTLPILAGIMRRTGSKVQHIVLWDVRTYRVMKRVELLMEDDFPDMMVFDGKEDITSLVVASHKEISIIKINVTELLTGC